jgi:hypothetical protein
MSHSWARSIHSIPSNSISLSSILILSTPLHLGLSSGLFPSGFHTNILYAFLLGSIRATFHAYHPPWLDRCNYTWQRVKVVKLFIMHFFFQPPVTSSLLSPNILSTLFSNTFQSVFLP